jgi:antibiotic biosynthesis monooxygenase (ABM) superfamily enzyme
MELRNIYKIMLLILFVLFIVAYIFRQLHGHFYDVK